MASGEVAVAGAAGIGSGQGLAGRRILLIVGGGIAAYKALDLIRRLRERGAARTGGHDRRRPAVRDAARGCEPVGRASVYDDLFSLTDEAEMGHIELSRERGPRGRGARDRPPSWPRWRPGLADDLATTLLLATDKRVLLAPSMNVRMWLHPATRRNRALLAADGHLEVGPGDGIMACGEFGPGRMAEPLDIVAAAARALAGETAIPLPEPVPPRLRGRRVVVTSGPTHEPIDPVRYIANRSSGRQGHAIAAAAAAAGAEVVLVLGPVSIPDPPGVRVERVETAREMLAAVEAALPADLFVATAAVADWRPEAAADLKIKKRDGAPEPTLLLARNPDILAAVAGLVPGRPRLVVGFAAETDRLIEHAAAKLQRKGCDLIVANDVGDGSGIMGGPDNEVRLVTRGPGGEPKVETWPRLAKDEVARRLVLRFADLLDGAGA